MIVKDERYDEVKKHTRNKERKRKNKRRIRGRVKANKYCTYSLP